MVAVPDSVFTLLIVSVICCTIIICVAMYYILVSMLGWPKRNTINYNKTNHFYGDDYDDDEEDDDDGEEDDDDDGDILPTKPPYTFSGRN